MLGSKLLEMSEKIVGLYGLLGDFEYFYGRDSLKYAKVLNSLKKAIDEENKFISQCISDEDSKNEVFLFLSNLSSKILVDMNWVSFLLNDRGTLPFVRLEKKWYLNDSSVNKVKKQNIKYFFKLSDMQHLLLLELEDKIDDNDFDNSMNPALLFYKNRLLSLLVDDEKSLIADDFRISRPYLVKSHYVNDFSLSLSNNFIDIMPYFFESTMVELTKFGTRDDYDLVLETKKFIRYTSLSASYPVYDFDDKFLLGYDYETILHNNKNVCSDIKNAVNYLVSNGYCNSDLMFVTSPSVSVSSGLSKIIKKAIDN